MKTLLSAIALSLVFLTASLSIALARPVTDADLAAGKKICWSDGHTDTFYSGGRKYHSAAGWGTWKIMSVGVSLITERWNIVVDWQILPDGTLTSDYEAWGRSWHFTGHYC
jgi:hypothetical protein